VDGPEHSGAFQAGTNDGLAAGFDHPGAGEETLCTEGWVAHPVGVALKVVGFVADDLGEFRAFGRERAQNLHQYFDLALIEKVQTASHPALAGLLVIGKQLGGELPEMLAGMVEIDDLDGAREVLVGQIPDPNGAVGNDCFLVGPAPAAPPGFGVEPEAKLLDFARAAVGFRLHYRHTGAVHLEVEHGYGGDADLGKVQLLGTVNLGLVARGDIGADGFGMAFHGLGSDLQTGQQSELLAPLAEAGLAAHHGHHAPHTGGEFRADDVQFHVARALALVAVRTDVVGALDVYAAQHRRQLLGARLVVARGMAAVAGHRHLHRSRPPQQLGQCGRTRAMHGGT
jgi:hypothetical protein